MMSVWLLGLLSLVSGTIDRSVLYPGYTINFNTPKNNDDGHYAMFPVEVDPANSSDLIIKLSVSHDGPSPKALVQMSALVIPTNQSPLFSSFPSDTVTMPAQDNTYWLTNRADCTGTVPTCYESVEAEISALTTITGNIQKHWPPYMMMDQRRTAKFDINSPGWIYFWLLVTNENLKDGIFALYMGVQYWSDQSESTSSVQMSVYTWDQPWPTANATDNSSLANAIDYYPRGRYQNGDWIQSTPTTLNVGRYKIGAQSTVAGDNAQFTVKVGFNTPPTQAANLNASFHLVGFLALISVCLLANVKHFFF